MRTLRQTRKNGLVSAFAVFGGLAALTPQTANAATPDFAVLLTLPALVDQVLLLVALASIAVAFKVYSLVKGGLLAKSWQLFVVGMLCLAIAQIFELARMLGYFTPPDIFRPVILLCMAALWLFGAYKARKALS